MIAIIVQSECYDPSSFNEYLNNQICSINNKEIYPE